MRYPILLLLLLLSSVYSFAQASATEIFNSHKFPCDTGLSTIEINICSGEKAYFADSLLNVIYRKILLAIDKEIAVDNIELKKAISIKSKTKDDEFNIGFLTKEIAYNKKLKQAIINSQVQWIKLRDANNQIEEVTCEGGTGCIAIVNLAEIDEILARIKKLESFHSINE